MSLEIPEEHDKLVPQDLQNHQYTWDRSSGNVSIMKQRNAIVPDTGMYNSAPCRSRPKTRVLQSTKIKDLLQASLI